MVGSLLFGITACFDVGASPQTPEVFNTFGLCVHLHGVRSGLAKGTQSLDSVEHSWDQN